jgi:hypothetical protein
VSQPLLFNLIKRSFTSISNDRRLEV